MKEINKIRIGNDIRLAVDLSQYIVTNPNTNSISQRKVYNTDTGKLVNFSTTSTPVSIRSIKAYLVSTTGTEDRSYNLRTSGLPVYHVHPYNGFGVNPRFDLIYKRLHYEMPTKYEAQTYATSLQNVVEVFFPADDQHRLGVYKLIIVAKLYAPGFNRENLKTVTVDMDNVFELVATTEEGVDTGISINVNVMQDLLPGEDGNTPDFTYDDKYLVKADFDDDTNIINLQMSDGENMTVDLNSRLGVYYAD